MREEEIFRDVQEIKQSLDSIKEMLRIIVGDRRIGRSNSPGVVDEILDCLNSIERNTDSLNSIEKNTDSLIGIEINTDYLSEIKENTNSLSVIERNTDHLGDIEKTPII